MFYIGQIDRSCDLVECIHNRHLYFEGYLRTNWIVWRVSLCLCNFVVLYDFYYEHMYGTNLNCENILIERWFFLKIESSMRFSMTVRYNVGNPLFLPIAYSLYWNVLHKFLVFRFGCFYVFLSYYKKS